MILIQDKILSDDLFSESFFCQLESCKGACCWEGDFGAPLDEVEMEMIDKILPIVSDYMSESGKETVKKNGPYRFYKDSKAYGTSLQNQGACAYMTLDDKGIAQCAFEKAYEKGRTDFQKPISCHLYPIRIENLENTEFEALNYDRWEICSAACKKGNEMKMPIFRFVKQALIRKFGEAFYEEVEEMATYLNR